MTTIMTPAPERTLGVEEAVARARELIPLLTRNAVQTETQRRVVEENIEAIRAAGLFKIMVPRRLGGEELPIRGMLAVSSTLGRGCGSTAWVTALTNVCAWFTGLFSDRAQREIFGANPDARVAGVFTPCTDAERVDGGIVVNGKWAWASGCLHADWALVGTPPIVQDGVTVVDQSLALVPMSELTIEDTWFSAGMKGTGSNTLVGENVFIPTHRLHSAIRAIEGHYATEHTGEALYRSSFIPVAALILSGPILGLAEAALEYVLEKSTKRSISYSFYSNQTQAPTFQLAVAEAAALVDTARFFIDRALRDIDGAAAEGRMLDYVQRARVRMDTGVAATKAREAIRVLCSAHGASSFAEASPLQRMWRDAETASRHAVIGPEISQHIYGQALVGIIGQISPLV